jgi:hypothetical protein
MWKGRPAVDGKVRRKQSPSPWRYIRTRTLSGAVAGFRGEGLLFAGEVVFFAILVAVLIAMVGPL